MENKKQKCYIYTRVSTEMQVDGYSLEAQNDRLRKEAQLKGMKVVGEYSDAGRSGKNISGRPEFARMLQDIGNHKDDVDYVLVFKLSRFGRNTADILNSLQYMQDYGVHLLCVSEGIDSDGVAGKFMIPILAAVAEIERENIHEQTMAGREQKARDGRWNGGFAPYGYKLEPVGNGRENGLVINEDEAELIRVIYKQYLKGNMGISKVAKWCNENGYQKILRQNGTITGISSSFVKGVLDNPVYAGKIAYGRRKTEKIDGKRNEFHVVKQDKDSYVLYEGQHEAIIDWDTWQKVQVKRGKNAYKREKTHSIEHEHVLSGIIKCPECGSPMYGVVNRKKKKGSDEYYKDMWYYRCNHRKNVTGHPCSYVKHIAQADVDTEVFALIRYLLGGDNGFKDAIIERIGAGDKALAEAEADKERIEKQVNMLMSKKKKQLIRINNLDIDDEFYDDLMTTYRDGLSEISEQLAVLDTQLYRTNLRIENAKNRIPVEVCMEMLDNILNHLEDYSPAEAKQVLNDLVERVDIFPERQPDGRWIKSIQLKFSLIIGDTPSSIFNVDGYHDDTVDISLPKETTDETVCLLSKKAQ